MVGSAPLAETNGYKAPEGTPPIDSPIRKEWNEKTEHVLKTVLKSQGGLDKIMKGAQKGKVVTRFPPEPSGFLHIGHAKAAYLNDWFAHSNDGTLILRFDDTNTDKSEQNFEENIIADLAKMKIWPDHIEWTSDYFDKLLDYCEMFIKENKAYCDDTDGKQMSKERFEKIENANRSKSVEENLEIWKHMKAGDADYKHYVVRAKINMQSDNGCMRDPVMYRSKDSAHFRTGTDYKAYPTYDFSCPIVDSLSGVTHAFRSLEYSDRKPLYDWILWASKVRKVKVNEFGRMDFTLTCLSKRMLRSLVQSGKASGWDDPRFPTIQGCIRRGMQMVTLRAFILSQGASRNDVRMEWDKFWGSNKKVIDPIVARFVAINEKDNRKVTVVDGLDQYKLMPKHKKNASLGLKNVLYQSNLIIDVEDALADGAQVGKIMTFMDYGNMLVTARDDDGNLTVQYQPDNQNFKGTMKVTWLPDVEDLVPIKVIKYGNLLTKEVEKGATDLTGSFNENSIETSYLKGMFDLKLLKAGEIVQLERRGYYRCDKPLIRDDDEQVKHLVLVEVPDGRKK